jgi:hypothetical protein
VTFDLSSRTRKFGLSVVILLVLGVASTASATTYAFSFDNLDDGSVMAPFVGKGTMSFDETLSDGEHPFTSLTNVNINFLFGNDAFKDVDIVTPLDEVLVVISNNGQSLNFSNVNGYGGGPFVGSIDFVNPNNQKTLGLSTEPPDFGGNLDLFLTIDPSGYPQYFGNYGGTLVPEPGTGFMLLAAMVSFAFFTRRR